MNKKQCRPIFVFLFLILIIITKAGSDSLGYDEINYFLPVGNDRSPHFSDLTDRIIGRYGDYRKSHIRGHKHSGIDIKGNFNEPVYSIGQGVVSHIFRDFPHKTIYIRHQDERVTPFYSVYIHVEDIQVHIGESVTENTIIGRLFNPIELEQSDFGTPPHLHFEIRHNIDDKGNASFSCMTIRELNDYCMNPIMFFRKKLR
jgi:murein DD-endopeptidase MepM/ murein hydrolase activator NlpD